MPLTPTSHPDLMILADPWHARRDRHLVDAVSALAEHLIPAVAHATGTDVPFTFLSISTLSSSAWKMEAILHRHLIGRQNPLRLLQHVATNWRGLARAEARTALYRHDAAWIAVNPQRLRDMTTDQLVDVLGHELVHATQLTTPDGSARYIADLRHNYKVAEHSRLDLAQADLIVAEHELAAYQAEAPIREAVRLHRAGQLPAARPALAPQLQPWDMVGRAEDHHDHVCSDQVPAQLLLETLRYASPATEVADWVRDLAYQLQEVDGQQGAADQLADAVALLEQAAELIGESVLEIADTEEFIFHADDVDAFEHPDGPDPVTLSPARQPVAVG
ncbi:hypothetical protein [Streptacidiphilus sp. EB129]|uniref:hypothetical protein n=1 Tax=Streptacidiphilus sp. EB129 TaxID=3156262 RepID=UPI0035183A32